MTHYLTLVLPHPPLLLLDLGLSPLPLSSLHSNLFSVEEGLRNWDRGQLVLLESEILLCLPSHLIIGVVEHSITPGNLMVVPLVGISFFTIIVETTVDLLLGPESILEDLLESLLVELG